MNKLTRWGAMFGVAGVLVFASAGVAGAQDGVDPYTGPSPTVESEVIERGVPAEVQAQTVQAAAPAPQVEASSLAFTGGDVGALVGIGVAALLVGGILLVSRRRTLA